MLEFFRKNRIAAVAGAIVVLCLIIFIAYLLSSESSKTVPSSFTDARSAASQEANDIVSTLAVTAEKIKEVKRLVEEHRNDEAVAIVKEESDKSPELRNKAINLALELEKMARAIPDIRSDQAAQVALGATSKETALISQLLSYMNELEKLLNALRIVVLSTHPNYTPVNEAITTINRAADEINALNTSYISEMEHFDQIINGGAEVSPT